MAWATVYESQSGQALESIQPTYSEIPAGSLVDIEITLVKWAPVARLADLAGAEWWGQQLAGAELKVTDVEGVGNYTIIIHGTAVGLAPLLLIGVLAVCLTILGVSIAWITTVRITANIEEKKLEVVKEGMRLGYTPEQISQVLEGVKTSYTPSLNLPTVAGISAGVLVVGAVVLFLILRK